ncbi:MAG: hypothetical protein PVF34_06710 [Gammaproteobacteria bacterium]|jgi:hypothetical protein
MKFKEHYPNLEQWLNYGGTLEISPIGDGVMRLKVADSEGLADEYDYEIESVDEGLTRAEKQVALLIEEANDLRSMYLSGEVKSADQEVIHITGVAPFRNPLYDQPEDA